MYTRDRDYVMNKYNLSLIRHLERYVSQRAHVAIPFNNYVTGSCAFTHKAGVHSKAVMQNPEAYEVINPQDFGVERRIELAHRLTGWNAMKQRCVDLGLSIPDDKLKIATVMIKDLSDERTIGLEELDKILISLGTKSKPNAAFITWAGAEHSNTDDKAAVHAAEARAAIDELEASQKDDRPTVTFQFDGHLFDKAVLNRLLDLAVDSSCDFTVQQLDVPNDNNKESRAVIKVIGDEHDIDALRLKYQALLQSLEGIADTQMNEI
jgi:homocitrate synthase